MEEITQIVVPEVPKVIPNEQLYVYIPIANGENPGIVIYDSDYFTITNGVLTIKHSSNTQIGVIRGTYDASTTDFSKDVLINIVDGIVENIYLKQTIDNVTQYVTILQVVSNLDDIKVKMVGEASKNAKSRAESMVSGTNGKIGIMNSAKMGVFQIVPVDSTDVSDYGINDTSSKEKKVIATVSATFTVK